MRFIPISDRQREAMLRAVGVSGIEELFEQVPHEVRLSGGLERVPPALSEPEVFRRLAALAELDPPASPICFAGAGCYDHYIPAIVDHVVRKPEFFTAYTPYQPEVSQGTLQATYEFQTMIARLTGMDVANASMYDGATAAVEAAYLAVRHTGRRTVVIARTLHPEWRETMRTYASAGLFDVIEAPMRAGVTDIDALGPLAEEAACVVVAYPDFYGCVEDVAALGDVAHASGALLVVAANPILLGVLESPGALGADVVVGEGQPLGNPMSFGGPGLGFFAAREQYLRTMPGRIVGRTVDVDGRDAYVLTIQTREQHIRREHATSNICSNQALCALIASVYLSVMGDDGLAEVGRQCIAKAHYLHDRLLGTARFERAFEAPFAHEFALRFEGEVGELMAHLSGFGLVPGVWLGEFSDDEDDLVLFAVTEKRTRDEMDLLVEAVESL